jgi:hypothetical protein
MSLKLVVLLAFIGSIALTMLLLSCTLKFSAEPDAKIETNCYTMFVLFFYVLAPIPILIARRVADDSSSVCYDLSCMFRFPRNNFIGFFIQILFHKKKYRALIGQLLFSFLIKMTHNFKIIPSTKILLPYCKLQYGNL